MPDGLAAVCTYLTYREDMPIPTTSCMVSLRRTLASPSLLMLPDMNYLQTKTKSWWELPWVMYV